MGCGSTRVRTEFCGICLGVLTGQERSLDTSSAFIGHCLTLRVKTAVVAGLCRDTEPFLLENGVMVCGKTSARLAKKRQDHTSQRQSTQYVEPPAHCQSQGASSSSQTPIEAAVLATNKDPVTCPPGELNPRCPLQHSTSLSPSVEESAAAWLRMV